MKQLPTIIIVFIAIAVVFTFLPSLMPSGDNFIDPTLSYLTEWPKDSYMVSAGDRYGIRSAKVEYVYGGIQEGSATLYFDNYGAKEVMMVNTKIEGSQGDVWESNSARIIINDSLYVIDLSQGSISERELVGSDFYSMDSVLRGKGAVLLGKERILGKDAEVWEIRHGDGNEKRWVWNSILLKIEIENNTGEISTMTAQSVEEGISIPEELLNLAKN